MILLCDNGAVNMGPWGGIALQLYVGPGHEHPLLSEGGLIGVSHMRYIMELQWAHGNIKYMWGR